MQLEAPKTDHLSATFAALADPTRRAILARLLEGHASVTELAEPFEMSLPAVSKHLKVLEQAGLISRGREAQWRPCRLTASPLRDVADWVEHYRQFWTQSLDRLDDYLRDLQTKTKLASTNSETSSRKPTSSGIGSKEQKNGKEKPNERD
jgi:DNA-binding transcriptional ArsR family regulator